MSARHRTGDIADHVDPRLERALTDRGLDPHLGWIALDDIDWDASTAYQIRLVTIDPETVERYTGALADGACFPAGLVQETGDGWLILGGMHRASAYAEAGMEKFPAYQLPAGLEALSAYELAVADNASHGLPLSPADAARHALVFIDTHRLSVAEVARRVGLSRNMIDRALAVRAGTTRAATNFVGAQWKRLPPSSQWRLQGACDDDEVFAEAVATAAACKLTTALCYDLATRIRSAADDTERFLIIEDFEAANAVEPRSAEGRPSTAAHRVRLAAIGLLGVDPGDVDRYCLDRDRAATAELADRAAKHLATMAALLTQPPRQQATRKSYKP